MEKDNRHLLFCWARGGKKGRRGGGGERDPRCGCLWRAGGGEQGAGGWGVKDSSSEIQISIQRTNRFVGPAVIQTGWWAAK